MVPSRWPTRPPPSPPSARRRRGPSLGGQPCLPCTGCTAATAATPQRGRRPSHPTTVVRLYCDPKRQLDVGFRPPKRAATLACLSGDVGARSARRGWAGLGLSPASGGRRRKRAEESPAMQAADRQGGRGGDAAGAQYSDRGTHRLSLRKSYVCMYVKKGEKEATAREDERETTTKKATDGAHSAACSENITHSDHGYRESI